MYQTPEKYYPLIFFTYYVFTLILLKNHKNWFYMNESYLYWAWV